MRVNHNYNPTQAEWEYMNAVVMRDPELRELAAGRIAYRLVESTNWCRNRHFSVIDERKPVPFPTHWRYKNTSGVSFKRDEVAAAEAWVRTALLAGFVVFHLDTKRGAGGGRGLESNSVYPVYPEDDWWLYQQLKARGLEYVKGGEVRP
jgi:hypothetical protein